MVFLTIRTFREKIYSYKVLYASNNMSFFDMWHLHNLFFWVKKQSTNNSQITIDVQIKMETKSIGNENIFRILNCNKFSTCIWYLNLGIKDATNI